MRARPALAALLRDLPPVTHAFAYGSGVFKQPGLYAKGSEAQAMLDYMLVVDDAADWHSQVHTALPAPHTMLVPANSIFICMLCCLAWPFSDPLAAAMDHPDCQWLAPPAQRAPLACPSAWPLLHGTAAGISIQRSHRPAEHTRESQALFNSVARRQAPAVQRDDCGVGGALQSDGAVAGSGAAHSCIHVLSTKRAVHAQGV
jgi:Phosphatidate cytidylyltransferase, mitochondrial